MKKKYTHLLFDLDHTLWDTNVNAQRTIEEMFVRFQLEERGIADRQKFIDTYTSINEKLWNQYSRKKIDKAFLRSGRFQLTLDSFGIKDEVLVEDMSSYFAERTPAQAKLIEHAKDVLHHLHGKYKMYIITNGFKEAQHKKLQHSGIDIFFDDVFISEELGYNKPDEKIFQIVLYRIQAQKENVLMIGDNLDTDVEGSLNAGIDCVFYNPQKTEHYYPVQFDIESLAELKNIL